jgi:hypothetical protein
MSEVLDKVVSSVVVDNSKTNLISQVSAVSSDMVAKTFSALIAERKSWEKEEFARSNQRLYGIQQSCYALYQEMNSIKPDAQALKQAFNKYCESEGMTFKASTHLMVKIVRCVFGDDRKRISAYAMTLRIAAEKKIGVLDLVKFINDAGGVEEVRRNKSNAQTAKAKAEVGKAALSGEVLASITSDLLNSKFNAAEYNGGVILLATKELDGSFAVRRLVQNGAAINNVLAGLASSITKEEQDQSVAKTAANDESMREQAVQNAISA